MIAPEDISGVDETVARRVLVYARSIAPCLDSLEGEFMQDALAILQGVADEVATRGSRQVASQRIGSAAVTYRELASCFSVDDRAGLRSLCSATTSGGLPQGSFPPPSRAIARMWPEECA